MKNKQLTVEIKDDELQISIGLKILKHACTTGRSYGLGGVKITDEGKFIESLVHKLKSEEEDGSTIIHDAFDVAVSRVLEDGDEGVDSIDD